MQLAAELAANKNAAVASYGTVASIGPVIPVRFTGTVDEGCSDVFTVSIKGLDSDVSVRVQTGPAINGTNLRDVTGEIEFGQFTNQIEYQDASSGISRVIAAPALVDLDRDALSGQTSFGGRRFQADQPKELARDTGVS